VGIIVCKCCAAAAAAGNHSRRLSTDHSKADRGSRRRKAVNTVPATCPSVPATITASAPPAVRPVADHDHSGSSVEPLRLRRSLRGVSSAGSAPEPV